WPTTAPSLQRRNAPTVLKIAPWATSVPTASDGLNPKTITRIGVISEPPPIPVIPTRAPISRPVRTNCQLISGAVRLDQDFGDLGPRELDRRNLAVAEHLAHLRPREHHAILVPVRAALRARHRAADLAPERVLEEH